MSDLENPTEFISQVLKLVAENNLFPGVSKDKVVKFSHPADLKKSVDFSLIEDKAERSNLLKLCESALVNSLDANHPHFYNQLYHGCDPVGFVACLIIETLNAQIHTYEVAPFFALAELSVLESLRNLVGWQPGTGDGIFSPGGSTSNMYALVMARYRKFPEVKKKGVHACGQLIAFTSEDCHYSFAKAANWIGLGTENMRLVKVDPATGSMDPADLERQILEVIASGEARPFFVNATAGTTVLGAYDPIDKIADICSKYELWLHVDAAWGGAVLFSDKYRHLLNGIERADSVAYNPHKLLGAPIQCASFLTRHTDILQECNSLNATYLFQSDKYYDATYDCGDKSIQCSRKVDAFKLWLMWKAHGTRGLGARVEQAYFCAEYFTKLVNQHPNFRLVFDRQQPSDNENGVLSTHCTNVCFYYIPDRFLSHFEDADILNQTQDWWKEFHTIAPQLKNRMMFGRARPSDELSNNSAASDDVYTPGEGCELMVGYQPLSRANLANFFRLVIHGVPTPTEKDMHFVLDELHRLGRDL